MELTAAVEAEVRETIQAYATAYQKKDITTLSAIFSPTITGFGSGPDEVIGNHDDFIRQIKRDMSQATILSVEFTDRKIFGDGRVAWATSKSAITFTTDEKKKQTQPVGHRAASFLYAVRGTVAGAIVPRCIILRDRVGTRMCSLPRIPEL
jgi:ketosteroid isomerase-like protein